MSTEDLHDPDEYAPELDPLSAAEEYTPEPSVDDPAREADPADVAEQSAEVPGGDDAPEEDDDETLP